MLTLSVPLADWDIVHDWGFPLRFWKLRATLLYPRPTYFVAIALNALLRCSWSITISPGFFGVDNLGRQNGLWLSSLTATGEVFRRFLWTLIRIENAHASSARPMLPDAHALAQSSSRAAADHDDTVVLAVPPPPKQGSAVALRASVRRRPSQQHMPLAQREAPERSANPLEGGLLADG